MKWFLLLLGLGVVAVAGAAEAGATKAAALERLKREFPVCLSGPLSDTTDPHIAECYKKWRAAADGVKAATLAEDVVRLRRTLHNEMREASIQQGDSYRVLRSDTKAAIRKNMTWLRTKVSPWVDRLASVQKGR